MGDFIYNNILKMNKFLLIDKPIWITSFDVLRKLRKIYNIKKLWHTGTLDPLATGLLLVAFWDYTKLIPYFEKAKKTYLFEICLDGTTPSFDKETEITYISEEQKEYYKDTLTIDKISSILKSNFSWPISQIPPKYSAIKIGWKKALDMVRKWEEFEVKKRDVIIHHIDIIDFNYPYITLEAEVSAWTYIRSIANDLWEIIGCWWYITKLRRTKIENLDLSLSCDLENLKLDDFLDEKYLFDSSKYVTLDEITLSKINNWLKVRWDFPFQKDIDLFVKNNEYITNIIKYDWECLSAVRKIV
jgi:tRNA pseudouridine55 synthase